MAGLAWLDSVPTGHNEPRRLGLKYSLDIPDLGIDVVANLNSFGYYVKFPDGIKPMSWQDLNHWMKATGHICSSWHAQTLIEMSRIYTQVIIASSDPSYACPVDIKKKPNKRKLKKLDDIFR